MSIEQALKDLTEAVVLNTTALNKLLAGTANVAGTAASADDTDDTDDTTDGAPKRERGKPSPGKSKRTAAEVAEDKAADEADAAAAAGDTDDTGDAGDTGDTGTGTVTFDELKVKLSKYLGEFAKPADRDNPEGAHPEVTARRDAIKAVLSKLGAEKLPDIAKDAEKVGKLNTWLEEKALTADRGHGIGRLAADPEPAGDDDADGGDDELDI